MGLSKTLLNSTKVRFDVYSPPSRFEEKNKKPIKNAPFPRKKTNNFSKKRALFDIIVMKYTQWFLAIFMEHRLNTAFSVDV